MTVRPHPRIVAVDTAFASLAEVEHSLLDLGQTAGLPDDVTACTHEVRDGVPHYAVSFSFAMSPAPDLMDDIEHHFYGDARRRGPGNTVDSHTAGIAVALAQSRGRDGGRAVWFPGWRRLVGTLTVAETLCVSAIDRVHQLGGGHVDPAVQLSTRGFVRPRWLGGELVLAVMPGPGGTVAPFEVPNPTPCCAAHPAEGSRTRC